MVPPATMISALKNNTDTATIHVRATRIWKSFNPYDRKLLYTNAILLDEEGNHIWAMIRNTQRSTYMKKLDEEGDVYIISRIMVVTTPEKYRSVERDVCINFYHETEIKKTDDTGVIPLYKFEVQDFDRIRGLLGDVRSFIDIVGWVVSYGDVYATQKGAKKLDIQLLNNKKEAMPVILWGDRAIEFLEEVKKIKDGPIFVVLTGLLAKTYFGELALSSGDGTKFFFNIDYPPLNDLKAAILDATGGQLQTLPTTTHKPQVIHGVPDVVEATIKGILAMKIPPGKQFVRCQCKARIIDIVHDEGWTYNYCPTCNHGVTVTDGKYRCRNCPTPPSSIKQGYRVSVTVEDASGTTTFTIFNKDVEMLIGVPIEKLTTEMGEIELVNDVPAIIYNMVGKVYDFQIKINSYNIKHRVEDYGVVKLTECQAIPTTGNMDAVDTDEPGTSATKKPRTI